VHGQRPRAGVRVPRGSAVSVTVEDGAIPPPPPPVTVPVPDVTGGTFAEARATLTHAGLLARITHGDRGETVESQKPRAGMLVAAGTVVTMRGAVPVSLTSGSTGTWRTLVLLVAGLGVGLGAAHRALKNDRAPDWVHTHVRLVAGAAPQLTAVRVEARQDARPAHVVRLAPHSDPGTSVLEEVRP